MRRVWICLGLATLSVLAGGCPRVSTKTKVPKEQMAVAKDATREELIEKFNALAASTKTLNATVDLRPTAGSKYSGLIEEYHEVKAFLLAKRPAEIRMIGQAPVVSKTIFDMTSDGQTFRVSLPTKNKFLVGEVGVERSSAKPLENLRPQHLFDALLWPEIVKGEAVLFEEFNDETARFYVLTVLRGGYTTEIRRKVWFDRADLSLARLQSYGPKGALFSDVRYSDWQPTGISSGTGNDPVFPRTIRIDRPHDDYRIDLQVTKLTLNDDLPEDRFQLAQPPNAEVVHVGQDNDAPPAKESKP